MAELSHPQGSRIAVIVRRLAHLPRPLTLLLAMSVIWWALGAAVYAAAGLGACPSETLKALGSPEAPGSSCCAPPSNAAPQGPQEPQGCPASDSQSPTSHCCCPALIPVLSAISLVALPPAPPPDVARFDAPRMHDQLIPLVFVIPPTQ